MFKNFLVVVIFILGLTKVGLSNPSSSTEQEAHEQIQIADSNSSIIVGLGVSAALGVAYLGYITLIKPPIALAKKEVVKVKTASISFSHNLKKFLFMGGSLLALGITLLILKKHNNIVNIFPIVAVTKESYKSITATITANATTALLTPSPSPSLTSVLEGYSYGIWGELLFNGQPIIVPQ